MKSIILAIFISSLYSMGAFAKSRCTVQGMGAILHDDMVVFSSVYLEDAYYTSEVETWQDCYDFAVEQAAAHDTLYYVTKYSSNYVAHACFYWSFNDGYIFDSQGSVTKFTKLASPNIKRKKSQCYTEDGRKFLQN